MLIVLIVLNELNELDVLRALIGFIVLSLELDPSIRNPTSRTATHTSSLKTVECSLDGP